MLEKGQKGEYAADWIDKIPAPWSMKYAEAISGKTDEKRMVKKLRDLIAFKPLNLMEDWPMKGKFDAIFCRNVVIYFDKPTQKVLFERYANALKDGGYLYIGHSETLNHVCDRFKLIDKPIRK
jgi:chemotaxis protein methyltransferase CheR